MRRDDAVTAKRSFSHKSAARQPADTVPKVVMEPYEPVA